MDISLKQFLLGITSFCTDNNIEDISKIPIQCYEMTSFVWKETTTHRISSLESYIVGCTSLQGKHFSANYTFEFVYTQTRSICQKMSENFTRTCEQLLKCGVLLIDF